MFSSTVTRYCAVVKLMLVVITPSIVIINYGNQMRSISECKEHAKFQYPQQFFNFLKPQHVGGGDLGGNMEMFSLFYVVSANWWVFTLFIFARLYMIFCIIAAWFQSSWSDKNVKSAWAKPALPCVLQHKESEISFCTVLWFIIRNVWPFFYKWS